MNTIMCYHVSGHIYTLFPRSMPSPVTNSISSRLLCVNMIIVSQANIRRTDV